MKMAKIESAMRVALEFNQALNRHDVAAMMALMSDDCVFENTSPAPDGTVYSGKEAVTQFWQDFFRASPQAHIQVEEILGEGVDTSLVPPLGGTVSAWRRGVVGGAVERRYYVYKRQGEPCLVCGSRVRTTVVAGRNLFWCGRCQRRR